MPALKGLTVRAGDSHTNAIVGQCAEVSHAHGKTQGSCPRSRGLGVQTRPPGASGELSEPAGKGPTEGPGTLTIRWRGLGGACAESDGLVVASRWEGMKAPCGQGGLWAWVTQCLPSLSLPPTSADPLWFFQEPALSMAVIHVACLLRHRVPMRHFIPWTLANGGHVPQED